MAVMLLVSKAGGYSEWLVKLTTAGLLLLSVSALMLRVNVFSVWMVSPSPNPWFLSRRAPRPPRGGPRGGGHHWEDGHPVLEEAPEAGPLHRYGRPGPGLSVFEGSNLTSL